MATLHSEVGNLTEIITVARAVLNGDMKVIEASRVLLKLKRSAGLAGEVFLPFIAIDSETDHLPVGPERELWPAEALAKKDQEIREVEEMYADIAREACSLIIEQFEPRVTH